MPRKGDHPRRDQFQAWLDRQTDPDAWLTKTYQQIGDEMVDGERVTPSVVRTVLVMCLADRLGIQPSEVIKRKADYRKAAQGQMTPEKLGLLREWRTQDPPVSIIDCAYRLDVSHQTIRDHCEKMGLAETP